MRSNDAIGADFDPGINYGVRSDLDARIELGVAMNNGRRMNHRLTKAAMRTIAKPKNEDRGLRIGASRSSAFRRWGLR